MGCFEGIRNKKWNTQYAWHPKTLEFPNGASQCLGHYTILHRELWSPGSQQQNNNNNLHKDQRNCLHMLFMLISMCSAFYVALLHSYLSYQENLALLLFLIKKVSCNETTGFILAITKCFSLHSSSCPTAGKEFKNTHGMRSHQL